MGLSLSRKKKHVHILVVGINSAGKTSLVYRLKFGQEILTVPTVGYQVEPVKLQSTDRLVFDMIDIGGASPIRSLWKQFFHKCDAIIYVVDAANRTRMEEAAREFERIRREKDCRRVPILVFANKQDLPNAANVHEVCKVFQMMQDTNKCHVQPCCARDGTGVNEGMNWLRSTLGLAK
jgi:small GTP-binding protein